MVCTANLTSGRACPFHCCYIHKIRIGRSRFTPDPRGLTNEEPYSAPSACPTHGPKAPHHHRQRNPQSYRRVTRYSRTNSASASDGTSTSANCLTATFSATGECVTAGAADDTYAAASTATSRPSTTAAIVLGIESSCDDTGVAVVTSDGRVLGEAIASQADVHAQWGGVVPNLARDAHAAAIDRTVDSALAAAELVPEQLSAVAVTIGPGLGLCLRVGVAKARQLARQYGIPLVSVHHMEAHALVARMPPAAAAAAAPAVRMSATIVTAGTAAAAAAAAAAPTAETQGSLPQQVVLQPHPPPQRQPCDQPLESRGDVAPFASSADRTALSTAAPIVDETAVLADVAAAAVVPFPFLCLLVSGGHNLLVLVRGVGSYVQLGTTVDDALGEAYDKVARLLNLELRPHGGAALEALAREGDTRAFKFAVPMRKHSTCDFSFAGLKTNTRLAIEQHLHPDRTAGLGPEQLRKVKADIAASFQSVAVTHLVEKTRRGVAWARELVPELRHLVVAGGVACNRVVRGSLQSLSEDEGLELVLPPPRWCTDNGVMVAWAGLERLARGWAEAPPPPAPLPLATAPQSMPHHQAAQSSVQLEAEPQTRAEAAPAEAAPAEAKAEWIELKPRWPLTSELHPRSAAAQQEQRRSVRKVRLHTPLSDLLPPTAAAAAAAAGPTVTGPPPAQVESATAPRAEPDAAPDASTSGALAVGAAETAGLDWLWREGRPGGSCEVGGVQIGLSRGPSDVAELGVGTAAEERRMRSGAASVEAEGSLVAAGL